MSHQLTAWQMGRGVLALVAAFLVLAVGLPGVATIVSEGASHRGGMWRIASVQFYPVSAFILVGLAVVSTSCVILGLFRLRWLEIVGWVIFGLIFLSAIFV